MSSILIIAAHPDDEVLGCGGTIRHFVEKGNQVHICFVTDGTTGRDGVTKQQVEGKHAESERAAELLGVTAIHRLPFQDMRLGTVPHRELNNALADVWQAVRPEIVFSHSNTDINLDHRCIYDAVEVLARPSENGLRELYAYEVPSSTEWRLGKSFVPTTFFNIAPHLAVKQQALACYKTELREFPHPRSVKGVEVFAQYRGLQSGYEYAEAFQLMRSYHNE